jgi:hypothetical protein
MNDLCVARLTPLAVLFPTPKTRGYYCCPPNCVLVFMTMLLEIRLFMSPPKLNALSFARLRKLVKSNAVDGLIKGFVTTQVGRWSGPTARTWGLESANIVSDDLGPYSTFPWSVARSITRRRSEHSRMRLGTLTDTSLASDQARSCQGWCRHSSERSPAYKSRNCCSHFAFLRRATPFSRDWNTSRSIS